MTEPFSDFDKTRLADYDEARIADAFAQHPDIYRNHLEVAAWIEGWAERDEEQHGVQTYSHLREIAAHLRQADLIPGGPLLDGIYK